jgi:hypothetical protein
MRCTKGLKVNMIQFLMISGTKNCGPMRTLIWI